MTSAFQETVGVGVNDGEGSGEKRNGVGANVAVGIAAVFCSGKSWGVAVSGYVDVETGVDEGSVGKEAIEVHPARMIPPNSKNNTDRKKEIRFKFII